MLGLYLDALSDEQRDRVIECEDFGFGQNWDGQGRGCLVAVAELGEREHTKVYLKFYVQGEASVGVQFDDLIARFGKARVVAACKARAARGNNITREAQQAEKDGRLQSLTGAAHADRVGCPSARRLIPEGGKVGRVPLDCGVTE